MSSSPHGSSHSSSKTGRRVVTAPEIRDLAVCAAPRGNDGSSSTSCDQLRDQFEPKQRNRHAVGPPQDMKGHRSVSPTHQSSKHFSGNQIARDAREISPFGVRAVPSRQSTDSRTMLPDVDNKRWDMFQDEVDEHLAELPETLGGVLYVVQRLLSSHELRLALDMIDYMLSVSSLANCQLTVTSKEFSQEMRPFLNEMRLCSDGIRLLEALIPQTPPTTLQPQKPASERPVRTRSSKLAKRETKTYSDAGHFTIPSLEHDIPQPGGWSRPHTEPSFTNRLRNPYRRWMGGAMSSLRSDYHSDDSTTEYVNSQLMERFGSRRAIERDVFRSEDLLDSSWDPDDHTQANRLQKTDSLLSIGRPCVAITSQDTLAAMTMFGDDDD